MFVQKIEFGLRWSLAFDQRSNRLQAVRSIGQRGLASFLDLLAGMLT